MVEHNRARLDTAQTHCNIISWHVQPRMHGTRLCTMKCSAAGSPTGSSHAAGPAAAASPPVAPAARASRAAHATGAHCQRPAAWFAEVPAGSSNLPLGSGTEQPLSSCIVAWVILQLMQVLPSAATTLFTTSGGTGMPQALPHQTGRQGPACLCCEPAPCPAEQRTLLQVVLVAVACEADLADVREVTRRVGEAGSLLALYRGLELVAARALLHHLVCQHAASRRTRSRTWRLRKGGGHVGSCRGSPSS